MEKHSTRPLTSEAHNNAPSREKRNGQAAEQWDALLYESYDLARLSQEWRKLYDLGTRLHFPKGSTIVAAGDMTDSLHFIDKGEVRVVRTLIDGREKILFRLHEGMLAGETPFFDVLPCMSAVVAASDCVLYSFDRKTVYGSIFPKNPTIIYSTMRAMASKIRMLCNQSVELTTSGLSTRICRFICQRAKAGLQSKGTGRYVNPALTQQELSSLLGVHRVTLNKALRDLENRGIIGPYSRKELFILDEERLLQLAELKEL